MMKGTPPMNNKPLFKKLYYSPVLAVFLIGVFSFFFGSIHGYCAENSGSPYFPMTQNYNNLFPSEVIADVENRFDSENYYIFLNYGYIDGNNLNVYIAYTLKNDGSFYGEIQSNGEKFNLYYVGNGSTSYRRLTYSLNNLSSNPGIYSSYGGDFENMQSSLFNSGWDYVSNFQLYTNNTDNAHVVLIYSDSEVIPDGDTASDNMEMPDIDDYIPDWSNPPIFDSSSVESALESVHDCIVWIGDNIKGTITGTGKYLADTLRWSIQKVLNTIRDVFNSYFDNVLSFLTQIRDTLTESLSSFKTFFDSIIYLGTENGRFSFDTFLINLLVPSASEIVDLMEQHDHFGVIAFWSSLNSKYVTIWNSIFNTSSVKRVYVPSTIWHGQTIGGFYIDFSWYDDYKVYGDTVISAFLIIGYFYWLYLNVNYFLRGTTPSHIPNMTDEKGVHL